MTVVWDANARPDRLAWAEVNLNAIAANASQMKRQAGTAALMAVVKADGYGHGLEAAARAALAGGATWVGIALLSEALQLRRALAVPAGQSKTAGQQPATDGQPGAPAGSEAPWAAAWPHVPLLVLGYTPPAQAAAAVAAGVRLTCDSIELAEAMAAAAQAQGRQAFLHVKVDTGMGRIGLAPADVSGFLRRLSGLQGLVVEGIFTHMADAEHPEETYTQGQVAAFQSLQAELEEAGLSPPLWHLANSAATMTLPGEARQLVRAGIALYGYHPSPDLATKVPLQPALAWKANLVHSKRVPAGSGISYGCTFRAPAAMTVGTVPVGYGDGYSRHWSNKGHVLVRGRRVPVIGRVCMDQFMVSLEPLDGVGSSPSEADLPPIGEEVVLLGRQGDEAITAADLADGLGTIAYEVLCLIGRRVPRLYMWDGAVVGCRNMAQVVPVAGEFDIMVVHPPKW